MHPDRIVIGTENGRARLIMNQLYQPLQFGRPSIVFTTPQTSELIKYVSNAYLAMKISFINEIADLCEAIGADVKDVAYGVGLDHRIGHDFLNAGLGSVVPALIRIHARSCEPRKALRLAFS
jgi:UDPglucose 6-dehydrogenase